MKLILFATFLTLALTSPLYFRVPGLTKTISDSAPSSITDYYTSFFAFYGLDQPNQILRCFNEKNAWLYFQHVYGVADLVKDAESRDKLHVHLDWLKLKALKKSLEGLHGCIAQTEDFSKLLEALGAKERNPHLFKIVKYTYLQANFGKLSERLPHLTGAIDEKNFTKAGHIAACIVNKTSSEIKSTGLALQALNAFWNGVHLELGLPDAESVWGCWNNETAFIRLEFIYGLSHAVSEGKWSDAAYNSGKWYEEKGKELLKKIPQEAWKCWKTCNDTLIESAKLKVDIASPEYWDQVNKFVHGKQAIFWQIQKAIKESLDHHNFIHAGGAYANLLKAAAKTS